MAEAHSGTHSQVRSHLQPRPPARTWASGVARAPARARMERACAKLARRARSVDERYPSAAYLGLAFWLAWPRVTCPALWGAVAAWSPSTLDAAHTLCIRVVITVAVALVVIVCALLGRRLGGRVASDAFLAAGGLVACAGTVALTVAAVAPLPLAWFAAVCVVAGVGMGMLLARCMAMYDDLAPQRILLVCAAAWGLSFVIDLLFRAMPLAVAVPLFCVLPLALAALLGLYRPAAPARSEGAAPEAGCGAADGEDVPGGEPLGLPGPFWRFAFTVFLVSLVSEMVVYLNSYGEATRLDSMSNANLTMAFACAALVAYGAAFPRSYIYRELYYPTVFVVMALLGLLFAFPAGTGWALTLSLAACQFFGLLVWCLFGCVTAQSKVPSLRAFGLGNGIQLVGTALGYLAGVGLVGALGSRPVDLLAVCLAAAMIALALSLIVYPPATMGELLLAIPDEDAEAPSRPSRAREGDWDRACGRLADEASLTSREREVMTLLVRGRGSVHIADSLGVALSTVYTHTRNIYRKFGVHSREELIQLVEEALG